MSDIYNFFLYWLPAPIRAVIMGLFAVLIIFLVIRIVIWILDSLPFL